MVAMSAPEIESMFWYNTRNVPAHNVHRLMVARNAAELVRSLEDRIADGSLRPGDRLQPVRAVAAQLGLAPNTVAGAYRVLRERGFTVARGRAGTFVADRPALGGIAADVVPEGLVDLASGHPDSGLLPDIAVAMRAMSYVPATYTTSPTSPELADVFRGDLAADGVAATDLAVVGGALDGLERVLLAHLRPGDAVAVEDPAYASVLDLLAALGLRAIPVPIDDEGPDPDGTARALDAGCEALVVTPRAQNPTGAAITAGRARALAAVVSTHPDLLVVEDDHAGQVAGASHHPIVNSDRRRWAVVRSVSKSLGPDLRLAVVAGDDVTIRRVVGRQAAGTGWVSHVLQSLVVELRRTGVETLQVAEQTYARRRELVIDALGEAGIAATGQSGLNVWVPVVDETWVVTAMERHGYAIRAGARFRIDAPPGVRVTVASSSEDELRQAAGVLSGVLRTGDPRRIA